MAKATSRPTQPAYSKSGYGSPAPRPTKAPAPLNRAATQMRAPLTKAPAPLSSPSAPPKGYSTGPGKPNPRFAQQSAPQPSQFDYGSGPSGSDWAGVSQAMAPQVNPDTDYLQEAGYLATVSALDEALANFKSQDTSERQTYDLDYKKGLGDLGYKDENIDDEVAGTWDWNDMLTASGRGYQNNTNDFASRGMLQSQGYLDSLKMLERSLEDQRGAMGTARQGFRKDRDSALANYTTQDTAARNTAKVDAITRLQQSLGLV